ncbi:hypothetical protein ACIRPX_40020 [Streptomyces sp. NPDC101225]|uniref:hypothetical protein n=1 Tax=Streptomyces sp. NPDC101225 TaxID=3366135 RepID=UPI00381E8682
MRRSVCFTMLFGILLTVVPTSPATAAGDGCDAGFSPRLRCWSAWLGKGAVTVRLNQALPLDTAGDRADLAARVVRQRENLAVQVPAGVTTGEGGTVLLVLAGHRFVDPRARVSRLTPSTVRELKQVGACDPRVRDDLCTVLGAHDREGTELAARPDVATLGAEHSVAVGPAPRTPAASSAAAKNTSAEHSGPDPALIGVAVLGALLALLLAAFVHVVRRSRSLAAPGAGALRASPGSTGGTTGPARTGPGTAPRPGPPVRTGPTRPAVVRTCLHPQGYVEIDRVLHRAVWARPERTPPAPGAHVDVADAADRDADVLYAFPPATGRHTQAR